MAIEADNIIRAWNIRLDRVPQLQKIARENNFDFLPLVTYEALYYVMAQWGSAMSWPNTPLTQEIINSNEISRPYLAQHAKLFLNVAELPVQVARSIEPVIQLTQTAWSDTDRVRSAREKLDKIIDNAEKKFAHDPLFLNVQNYFDSHEEAISQSWNRFVKNKYGHNN